MGPEMVRFRPEIEPVVRWIEDTPRDQVFEKAVAELEGGLSYRSLLAGLFLAGIRNIKPRPVGFKFHAVMVINSAHLLGQTSAVSERLLPLFWALDNFKNSQAADVKEGDWALGKVDESRVPAPHRARTDYLQAMEAWDSEAADAAVAGLCRGPARPRSWSRSGGWPSETSGTSATSPSSRPRAGGPCKRLAGSTPSRCSGRSPTDCSISRETGPRLSARTRPTWKPRRGFARIGQWDGKTRARLGRCSRRSARRARSGLGRGRQDARSGRWPRALWDAVVLSASELMMKNPGIISLHATTASNALHYIFHASGDDLTRQLALLQAVGWQPLYRERAKSSSPLEIDSLAGSEKVAQGDEAVGEIFATINDDRKAAAAQDRDLPGTRRIAEPIFDAARRMIFHKGTDSHDYKYGAAIWEECLAASEPRWHAPLAAAAMFHLPGARTADSPLMIRAREAVAKVMG